MISVPAAPRGGHIAWCQVARPGTCPAPRLINHTAQGCGSELHLDTAPNYGWRWGLITKMLNPHSAAPLLPGAPDRTLVNECGARQLCALAWLVTGTGK